MTIVQRREYDCNYQYDGGLDNLTKMTIDIPFFQVATLHSSVTSKQRAVDALDKLKVKESTVCQTAAGYMVAADADEGVKNAAESSTSYARTFVRPTPCTCAN